MTGSSTMPARRGRLAATAALALVSASLATFAGTRATADDADRRPAGAVASKAMLPAGFRDTTVIGGLSEPVSVAFAPDGTAFVALKTGGIKSFDYNGATSQYEPAATSTDFADLTVEVENYGDRGLTGIAVDPQFPARPYVYVNYTLNLDPAPGSTIPSWARRASPTTTAVRTTRTRPRSHRPRVAARCSTGCPG